MTKSHILNSYSGETIEEFHAHYPNILEDDGHGFWVVVSDGRKGFGLTGESLIDFVRNSVRKILEAGGIPVVGGAGTAYEWIYQPQYGINHDEIINNIVEEWLRNGGGEDDYTLWFAHPNHSDIDIAPKEQKDLS